MTKIISIMLALMLSLTVACGGQKTTDTKAAETKAAAVETKAEAAVTEAEAEEAKTESIELTLEQLKEFDGKDGRKAYVAVDGIIYDMTDSAAWKSGGHNGFQAGRDLTDAIKKESPHGVGNLERVPAVGKIVD